MALLEYLLSFFFLLLKVTSSIDDINWGLTIIKALPSFRQYALNSNPAFNNQWLGNQCLNII